MKVPFLDLASQQSEIAEEVLPAWDDVLRTALFVGGPHVDAFETQYADYIGVRNCVGVANGTDALELAYRAAGVRGGDEVIMPANTFVATAEAASRVGAVPVFVDVDEQHLLIDPEAVEAAVTSRTRAIAAVHLFGQTAPIDRLRPVAERHGLVIVEDAAQAQGAVSTAGRAGALGLVSATSFYPGKNLGAAGDAGAVLTDDEEIARVVRTLAAHGSREKYVHEMIGINSRLDAIQAIVLRAKLRRLDQWNAARREVAARYTRLLGDIEGIRLPSVRPGNEDVWHLYVIRVDGRDSLSEALGAAGIGVGIHYPTPVHLTPAYSGLGYAQGSFPVAESAAEQMLSLPMYPHLQAAQQDAVVDALRTALVTDGLGVARVGRSL